MAAVHQYMYFHFLCDDKGLDLLAGLFKRTAIEEMVHIEDLAERILFLGGEVNLKAAQDVQPIKDVEKMLEMACEMERSSVMDYNKWALECSQNFDAMSKQIFEKLVADEERHFDQYDTELTNLNNFGDRYLALQSIERSKSLAAGNPGE